MPRVQPYAAEHAHRNGPGDARPTAEQVLRDQNLLSALPGTTILITGSTSGIGIPTARALYLTGATIYITARTASKGHEIAASISTDPARPVKVLEMSLDSFASIRSAAKQFLEQESKLHVLINNAGVMATPEGKTEDGFETQFGTNHLGHFLLFQLLKPALLAAATPERPARVVAVASTGHRNVKALDFENLNFEKAPYNPVTAYGNSKLANIYFANHLNRLYNVPDSAHPIVGLSLHPGSIETPLRRHMDDTPVLRKVLENPQYQAQLKSAEQGAATTVWAAVGKEWSHRGGVYLEDVGEAGPDEGGEALWRAGYSAAAYNPEAERELWARSEGWCGV
jgi:NAD(P)-dependent dehydrogenase (short-subunit alcohol dehydrogenase family)